MSMPFTDCDSGDVWPHSSMNHDLYESYCQFENAPPFKKLGDSDNNLPNSATFSAINSKVNKPNLSGNKGRRQIFYKTRMCTKFLEGTCRNGEHCTFAHGVEDLLEPPPNWRDLVHEKDKEFDDQKLMHGMKICKKFYDGEECPYGYKCNFLHEHPPKFNIGMPRHRESSAISIGTTGNISDPKMIKLNKHGNDVIHIKEPIYWKTKICSNWEKTGQCPFRDRCHFAHGQSELQAPLLMNSVPITPKHSSIPLADLSTVNTVVIDSIKEANEEKKIQKWKPSKKICEIYGDWLDGYVQPHLLFSDVES